MQEPLDLDELFHDCYFGDFGVPEDVGSSPEPHDSDNGGGDSAQKRSADEAFSMSEGHEGGISTKPAAALTAAQKVERRERNREHAKRSRLRKKFLLESLQEQIDGLQSEITALRGIVRRELPERASELLKDIGGDGGDSDDPSQPRRGGYTPTHPSTTQSNPGLSADCPKRVRACASEQAVEADDRSIEDNGLSPSSRHK